MNKIYTLILICFTLFAKADYWIQKADFGGSVRFGAFGFSIGNFGYIGGGYANGTDYDDFWQFDPSSNSWTQKSNLPSVIRLTGNFTINGKGYVVCGIHSTIVNSVYEYDPVGNNWTAKNNFPGVPVYGGASFSIGNKGYYGIGNAGSANGPYYTAFYEFDPALNSWSQKTAFPGAPRYGTYGISINGKGYAGFGGNIALNIFYNDWWEYDPLSNTWTGKAGYPGVVRSYPVGFAINNKIYLGVGAQEPVAYFSDFYEYDPILDSWIQKESFNGTGRLAATAFAITGIGYLGNGYDGTNYLRDFWEYSPDPTGIQELPNTNLEFTISPNPVKEFLLINYPLTGKEKINLTISDVNGKKILQTQPAIINNQSTISLKSFSKGIYFVEVNDGKQKAVKKFLKE